MRTGNDRELLTFKPDRLAVLVPYSIVLWALAWSIIRFRGPRGAFDGPKQIALYAATIVLTVPLNRLHLTLANLPKREIVNAVALTLACATTIDGICFGFFPRIYSDDPVLLRRGAAWIIWAGAVACFLAFRTRASAKDQDVI